MTIFVDSKRHTYRPRPPVASKKMIGSLSLNYSCRHFAAILVRSCAFQAEKQRKQEKDS
jgi:hypothetical protein